MKRRNFITSSLGATISSATFLNGLFMNRFLGNPVSLIAQPDTLGQFNVGLMDDGKSRIKDSLVIIR